MSELGPDYLPEMREALSRFCNEIRSFHTAQGLDPAPGSPAVNEHATAPLIESGRRTRYSLRQDDHEAHGTWGSSPRPPSFVNPRATAASNVFFQNAQGTNALGTPLPFHSGTSSHPSGFPRSLQPILVDRAPWFSISGSDARTSCARTGSLIMVDLFCPRIQGRNILPLGRDRALSSLSSSSPMGLFYYSSANGGAR